MPVRILNIKEQRMDKLNKTASTACTVVAFVFLIIFIKFLISYIPYVLAYDKVYGTTSSLMIFLVAAACLFLICAVTALSLGGEFDSERGEAKNKILTAAALILFMNVGAYFYSKVALPPLFYALFKERPAEKIESLITKNTDINKAEKGYTPLLFAVMYGYDLEIIKLLIDKGADVNASDKKGIPVLIHALKPESTLEVTEMLVDKGADVNAVSAPGKVSVLTRACLTVEDPEIVRFLIKRGAAMKTTSIQKFPVVSAALMNKSERKNEILALLLENGAPLNDADTSGVTPLMYAYVSGNDKAVRMLTLQGAYMDSDDSSNRTMTEYLAVNTDLSEEEKEERKRFIEAYVQRIENKKGYVY